jgi:hypothetical protein
MTHDDIIIETRTALAEAERRLDRAQSELARHRLSEPSDDPHALDRHALTERRLRDDIACAESDVSLLGRELKQSHPERPTGL